MDNEQPQYKEENCEKYAGHATLWGYHKSSLAAEIESVGSTLQMGRETFILAIAKDKPRIMEPFSPPLSSKKEHSNHLPGMLSEYSNNEVLGARCEGDDPNAVSDSQEPNMTAE